jgi:hypothetical protein
MGLSSKQPQWSKIVLLPRVDSCALPSTPTHHCYGLLAQDSLNNLRQAMQNTRIMCATMLDTKVGWDLQ